MCQCPNIDGPNCLFSLLNLSVDCVLHDGVHSWITLKILEHFSSLHALSGRLRDLGLNLWPYDKWTSSSSTDVFRVILGFCIFPVSAWASCRSCRILPQSQTMFRMSADQLAPGMSVRLDYVYACILQWTKVGGTYRLSKLFQILQEILDRLPLREERRRKQG